MSNLTGKTLEVYEALAEDYYQELINDAYAELYEEQPSESRVASMLQDAVSQAQPELAETPVNWRALARMFIPEAKRKRAALMAEHGEALGYDWD